MPNLRARAGALSLLTAFVLLASGATGGTAMARRNDSPSPATAVSPFFGEWELDLDRMPANYGPPPSRVLYAFEDAGAGQWRTRIDIMTPDGHVRHMAVQYRRDGMMAPGTGDTGEADSAAFISPAPNILVMSLAKDKRLGSVRTYSISADGREMTESAANVDKDGAPFVRNFHFRRLR